MVGTSVEYRAFSGIAGRALCRGDVQPDRREFEQQKAVGLSSFKLRRQGFGLRSGKEGFRPQLTRPGARRGYGFQFGR